MTRKEKTQLNRFDTKIAPVLKELASLCKKFGMPMLAAVQLFENEEEGVRVATRTMHSESMALPMTLSSQLMDGTTEVRVGENNTLQLLMPKDSLPDTLKNYAHKTDTNGVASNEPEPLIEHAEHCEDCRMLMEEAILRGESVDHILVPQHEEAGLIELLKEIRASKLPFIIPKNNIIH